MKILTMCPTRGRPKILTEMLDSFKDTASEGNKLVVYLNEDDPMLGSYNIPLWCESIVGKRKYLAQAYNYIFDKYSDCDFYCPCNDDHVFITPEWDSKLIEIVNREGRGWGLAAAEDTLTDWYQYQHPSGCLVSGNIPRTLGYFIWPPIQHIGIDCYFMHLMQGIGRLYHTRSVVIEHRHWMNGKRPLDANYKWVYNHAQFSYGMAMVEEYINEHLKKDVAKIQDGIRKERIEK